MGLLDDAIREHLDLKRRRGADPAEVERAEREALGPVRRGPEEPAQAELPAESAAANDRQQEPEWHEPFGAPEDHHDPFADERGAGPFAEHDPFADEHGAGPAIEHDPFAAEPGAGSALAPEHPEPEFDATPDEPEPLALEQQPRRRGFLRRKQQPPPPPTEHDDHADYLDDDDPFAEPEADVQLHGAVRATPDPADAAPPAARPHPPAAPPERPAELAGGETVEYEVEDAFKAERDVQAEDVLEETPEFLQDTPDHDRLWFEQRPPRDFDFEG